MCCAIREDWQAAERDLSLPGFHAVAVYRFGAWRRTPPKAFEMSLFRLAGEAVQLFDQHEFHAVAVEGALHSHPENRMPVEHFALKPPEHILHLPFRTGASWN